MSVQNMYINMMHKLILSGVPGYSQTIPMCETGRNATAQK